MSLMGLSGDWLSYLECQGLVVLDEIVRVCLSWLGIVRVLVVMDWIVRGLVEDGIGWLSWLVLEGLVVMDGIVRGLVVISGNVRG